MHFRWIGWIPILHGWIPPFFSPNSHGWLEWNILISQWYSHYNASKMHLVMDQNSVPLKFTLNCWVYGCSSPRNYGISHTSVNIQLIAISRSAKWAGKLWAGPKSDASAPFFPAKTGHKCPTSHPTRSRVTRAGHSFPSQLGREGSALQCPVLWPLVSFEWLETTRNSGKSLFLLNNWTTKVVGFVFLNGLTV